MLKNEFLISLLINFIVDTLVILITHILYSSKLKKELKNEGKSITSKQVEESLQFFRDVELETNKQEIFNIEELLKDKGSSIDLIDGEAIYPEFFNNWQSFNNFYDKIHECRQKYEKNLSCEVALNLIFIDRYLYKLSLFVSENGNEKMLPFWGTIFIVDLKKWRNKLDLLLVNELNKHNFKLESHESKKYYRLRKKILVKQYENTILNYLITNEYPKSKTKTMNMVKILIKGVLNS